MIIAVSYKDNEIFEHFLYGLVQYKLMLFQ